MKRYLCAFFAAVLVISSVQAQQRANDVTTPLHALQPDYPVPYIVPTEAGIKIVLDRIFQYLDSTTPPAFINRITNAVITNVADPDTNIAFKQGDFRLTSYEWGVTYGAMLTV